MMSVIWSYSVLLHPKIVQVHIIILVSPALAQGGFGVFQLLF